MIAPAAYVIGRWWLYRDSRYQFVGRNVGDTSVVYAAFGLVAEHFRPDGYTGEREVYLQQRRWEKAVRKWQRHHAQLWWRMRILMLPEDREDDAQFEERMGRTVERLYRRDADAARAAGQLVPTLAQLSDPGDPGDVDEPPAPPAGPTPQPPGPKRFTLVR